MPDARPAGAPTKSFSNQECVGNCSRRYYKAEHLTDVIEQTYRAQLATCNPQHLVASGWIAIPDDVSMTEQQAAAVFEACGAWDQNPIK